MTNQLFIGIAFAAIISITSYILRFLTFGGSLTQFLLGVVLLGFGGWQWTVPMLVFFVLSSLLSKFGKDRKSSAEVVSEKSSVRDSMQVIANGGVAGMITLAWVLTHNEVLYCAYLGAVAASTADTWGTELGMLSKRQPRLITTFKPVEKGRSGGVSVLGLLAGLFGAYVIWFSATMWFDDLDSTRVLVSILVAGLAGSLFDSFLGATIQGQFRCAVCGKITESPIHCRKRAVLISGFAQFRNDLVNLFCTVFGAAVGFFAYIV